MEERYIRNIGALSQEECMCLRGKRVFVAGCGGLGGYIIDMLLRVGVGHIAAADGDVFQPSNLNRQLFSSPALIGTGKAEAARAYALRVNPDVGFTAYKGFITESNAPGLIAGCDAVLDALDGIPARRLLKAACDRQGLPYIHGAVSGWTAQAAVSLPGDGLLDTLYPADAPASESGTPAFTPALCAALQCSLCVKLLCGRPLDYGRLYCFDLLELEFEKLF